MNPIYDDSTTNNVDPESVLLDAQGAAVQGMQDAEDDVEEQNVADATSSANAISQDQIKSERKKLKNSHRKLRNLAGPSDASLARAIVIEKGVSKTKADDDLLVQEQSYLDPDNETI